MQLLRGRWQFDPSLQLRSDRGALWSVFSSVQFSSVCCVVVVYIIISNTIFDYATVNIVAFWVGVGRKGAPHLYLDSVGVSS